MGEHYISSDVPVFKAFWHNWNECRFVEDKGTLSRNTFDLPSLTSSLRIGALLPQQEGQVRSRCRRGARDQGKGEGEVVLSFLRYGTVLRYGLRRTYCTHC